MAAAKSAYIFDFDGVLVNTMEAHLACYRQALEEVGVPIDRAQFYSQAGMTGREQIRYFAERAGKNVDVDAVYRRKGELFGSHIGSVTVIECNAVLLKELRAAGHPVAIATGSSRPSIMPVIARHGLQSDAVVSAEDVSRGKPDPELFLTAASRLGADPASCIVIEDSDVGIDAARRAGMRAMRFYDLPAARL